MHEAFTAILKAVDTLKSELGQDAFEFRCSDMSSTIEVIDLNCEEEHDDLDKIYIISYHVENDTFELHFESSLPYKSTFCKSHAVKLIEANIDFDIYKHRIRLKKENVDLDDLAEYVDLMSEVLFNF